MEQMCEYVRDGQKCTQPAEIEWRIGERAPVTHYCQYHYAQTHLPEDERDEIDLALGEDQDMGAYRLEELELKAHSDDPLDTQITINLQAFTLRRLDRYIRAVGAPTDRSIWINTILSTWLYEQGE
jgi:hypothetical protein